MSQKGTIIRYKNLEIICKSADDIYNFRKNNDINIDNIVLSGDEIFTDLSKGTRIKTEDLLKIFETNDINECIKIIINQGDFKLTTQEKRKIMESKKNEVIGYIQKYFIDPRTKKSYISEHIEDAIKKSKFVIDPSVPTDILVNKYTTKLTKIIPLKKNSIEAIIKIPFEFMGNAEQIIKRYASICRQKYEENYYVEISIIPGEVDNLTHALQKTTDGNFEFEY